MTFKEVTSGKSAKSQFEKSNFPLSCARISLMSCSYVSAHSLIELLSGKSFFSYASVEKSISLPFVLTDVFLFSSDFCPHAVTVKTKIALIIKLKIVIFFFMAFYLQFE